MSFSNIINDSIQNKFNGNNEIINGIGDNEKKEIEINNINNKINDMNSFDQLKDLQILIKKHAGLNELCKYVFLFLISYKRKK